MAFNHGKNAKVALRDAGNVWRDLTAFTGEVTVPSKAGTADTTVFGLGAKTFIGGLLEGQVTMKGFYDPTATSGPDAVLGGLLGTQPSKGMTVVAQVATQSNYGQFILFPNGTASSATNIAIIADVVLTDYNVSAPVTGVVAYTASFVLSGATTATDTLNGGTTTGAYGLQVIRVPTNILFNTAYITAAGGAANYAALIGSSK